MKIKFILLSKSFIILISFITLTLIAYHFYTKATCNLKAKKLFHSQKFDLNSPCYCRQAITYYSESENETYTCDLYNTFRRGKNQKVVSYSLYGEVQNYYSSIKYLSKLVAKYYPKWIIRIYHDSSINKTSKCEFECLKDDLTGQYMDNIDFCNINEIPYGDHINTWNAQYMHAMNWRFLPIGDSFINMFMSRDLDSWIVQREVDAVNVWLNSNTLFHVMRDHPQHNTPILGGMWGFANHRNREVAKKLFSILIDKQIAADFNPENSNLKGYDQLFLMKYFWEYVNNNATIQDSYSCESFGVRAEAYPSQRPKVNCFVACFPGCCDESLTNQTWNEVCPEECRPKEHKDWIYC